MFGSGMRPHPEALYYHIASDAALASQHESDEFRRKQFGATALVFSALCLEVFINQEYTRLSVHHQGRPSLRSKWLKFPRLLGATESFDETREPFATFLDLIHARNERLVHFKPEGEARLEGDATSEEYFGDLVGNPAIAARYFGCVAEMIHELHRLTEGRTDIPGFLTGQRYMSYVWASATVAWESVGPRGVSTQPDDPDAGVT